MLKKIFTNGRMNLDTDERLLPQGDHREALNVNIVNSEGSDVGAIENSLSNKQLTNIDLGPNPKTISWYEDEPEDKIYWHVKSDTGCFLIEWDDINQLSTIVLKDTRVGDERVLDLHEDFLITGIVKVISEDTNEDLLLWTDNNMQPCCINIERAKTWEENGFDLEDILLIKKPPRYAPNITPTFSDDLSNNLEERFISVSYRYKYRDGEYSALSDYANYFFYPKSFDLDYYTLDNKGMINSFNAMLIEFNTGDKRVTDIQVVIKESNSNSLYIVETFNKDKLSLADNETHQHIFSNDKIYTQLDNNELKRAFDNVPLKAKALTLIGNIPVFGNYLEGRNIVDKNGESITMDYTLSINTSEIETGEDFDKIIENNYIQITNPNNMELVSGTKLILYFEILMESAPVYSGDFFFILEQDYASLDELFSSEEFGILLTAINNDFLANYNSDGVYDVPDGWVVTTEPEITYSLVGNIPTISITPITFEDTFNNNEEHVVDFSFLPPTYSALTSSVNSTSVKTNRNLSVGVVYMDGFNRRTTVLTTIYNSIFIPQRYSIFRNSIRAIINNAPPEWADRYKLVVKTQPLQYQTIYVNKFYNEDFYVWCKLEAENKNKVNVGDTLIVKRAGPTAVANPIKVKVLDIEYKERDFISGNIDFRGNDVSEPSGTYMKIRPDEFSMDFDDYKVYQSERWNVGAAGYPRAIVKLFTEMENGEVTSELSIPAGSSIRVYIRSRRKYDAGWKHITYGPEHFAQRDYDTIEDWFIENIIDKPLIGVYDPAQTETANYRGNVSLVRGIANGDINRPDFTFTQTLPNQGFLYLLVEGLLSGGSRGRSGYLDLKVTVRTSSGFYVFETEPKQADNDIYYETAQCFDIVDGNHKGNNQDQDIDTFTPAIVDLDFFNCFTQGNGVESYRVRDAFNTKYLNIDLRPSATSIEPYRQVRRFADLTFGGAFIESSNINKLNEFNLALGNWKELDKQFGSVQRLESRDTDLIVLQEDKASKVLFGKDLLSTAAGVPVLTGTPEILGQQIPIPGENGIGLHPESFAKDIYRFYWVNPRRGTPIRYSMDGTSEINYGMIAFFRDLFIKNPTSLKVGGFDPYHRQYFLTVEDEIPMDYVSQCGNSVFKVLTEPFTYYLKLNNLQGDIVFNYNIQYGSADITLVFNGQSTTFTDLTGIGSVSIERNTLDEDLVQITVEPSINLVSVEITSVCPLGELVKVGNIVLCDETDLTKSMKNKYRWGANPFYQENHIFQNNPISKFIIEEGREGTNKFPINGETINIQAYKDNTSTGDFSKADKCNRIGYLISPNTYTEADIDTILQNATWLNLSETQLSLNSFVSQATFQLNKPANTDILYLIWDYTDRKPIANDDSVTTPRGSTKIIDAFINDVNEEGAITLEIVTPPTNGNVVYNNDGTFTYTHDDSNTETDSFQYRINNGTCVSNVATVNIRIALLCSDLFAYSGGIGYYEFIIDFGEDTGQCGIAYDALTIPDEFSIEWNGNVVASTGGSVSGQGTLLFDKTTAEPQTAKVIVNATQGATAWHISGVCPNVTPLHRPPIENAENE